MPHDQTFWERFIELHRQGDLHETARQLRHVVEAEPFAMTPRQWLAAVHLQLGQPQLALTHYDKLLTLAVGQGDMFRAIAVHKRIDALAPRANAGAGYAALHRWFRLLGLAHLVDVPSNRGVGLTGRSLLQLPDEAFVHAALNATLELFETTEPRIIDVEGLEQRVVLWGELSWDLKLPNGDQTPEIISVEGDLMRVDPALAERARMRVRPDAPAECLCFSAPLIRQLMAFDRTLAGMSLRGSGDIVREERSLLPSKPLQREDLDNQTRAPEEASGNQPPRLAPGEAGGEREPVEAAGVRDTGEWVDFGTLHLDAEPLRLNSALGGASDPGSFADIPLLDLTGAPPDSAPAKPVLKSPTPADVDDSPALGSLRDPFVEPPGLAVPPAQPPTVDAPADTRDERRGRDRVPLHAIAHLRLMGLHDNDAASIACEILDLSPGGIRLSFPRDAVTDAIRLLEDETLRIELDGPGHEPLRVAARMRWADLDMPGQVRAGLQFVLMASSDEQALAQLLEQAAHLRRVA